MIPMDVSNNTIPIGIISIHFKRNLSAVFISISIECNVFHNNTNWLSHNTCSESKKTEQITYLYPYWIVKEQMSIDCSVYDYTCIYKCGYEYTY